MADLVGSVSSIPHPLHDGAGSTLPRKPRGGEIEPTRPRIQAYFCHDCNRRFYNLGWHAEACGSSNFGDAGDAGDTE